MNYNSTEMKKKSYYNTLIVVLAFSTLLLSCETVTGDLGEDSRIQTVIENVSEIPGAENASITVNGHQQSFFMLEFKDIETNKVIGNGMSEGWCIDWKKPINSNNGTYSGIKLYNTFRVDGWKRLNYLLNIKEELLNEDPDLTYREIQVVIWSLRANPEFDLDKVKTEDLPGRMLTEGERNFSTEKVKAILDRVEKGFKNFQFSEGTKFAVIAATPADVQTVITVVE